MDSCVLPSELVMEILARSSVETIASCRVTSKEIYNMTYDSIFMKHFRGRRNYISGYFIQDLKRNKYISNFVSINDQPDLSLKFLPYSIKIEASTKQGILCCSSQEPQHYKISKYYVCKPSTNEWEQIPNPKTRYHTQTIAMMILHTKPLHYKIVRLSRHKGLPQSKKGPMVYYLHCEVFDSVTWAWKKLRHIEMGFCEFFEHSPTISSNGVTHWLTTMHRILAFDFNQETFTILEIPRHLLLDRDYYEDRTIVEYKGRLGIMGTWMGRYLELWVMNNHKDQEWQKKWTLDLEEFMHIEEYPCLHYPSPGACHDADFVVTKGKNNLTFYDTKNGSSFVVTLKSSMEPMFFYPFHSDFEYVDMKNQ